jgi:acyl carrier protein
VIAEFFGITPKEVTPKTVALDVDGWDSIAHTILMLEIERAFDIEVDMSAAGGIKDVGSLAQFLDAALAGRGNG